MVCEYLIQLKQMGVYFSLSLEKSRGEKFVAMVWLLNDVIRDTDSFSFLLAMTGMMYSSSCFLPHGSRWLLQSQSTLHYLKQEKGNKRQGAIPAASLFFYHNSKRFFQKHPLADICLVLTGQEKSHMPSLASRKSKK